MVLLQFFLTILLIVLVVYTCGDDFVEGSVGTVIAYASRIIFTCRPNRFVSVSCLYIHTFLENFVGAVHDRVNLSWYFLKTLFSEVSIFERVSRGYMVINIGEQSIVILGPILLRLFQEEARLYFGVRLALGSLHTPPLLAVEIFSKLRQFTTVDAYRHITELGIVIGHHLGTPHLIQLLASHFRGWHVRENSESAVLTFVHTGIAVGDFAYVMFHLFQLVEHLLASVILEGRLRSDLGLFNKAEAGCLDFILLVLVHIREVQLFASFLFHVLTSLNNRLYGWFRPIELTINVWFLILRLKPRLLLLKCLVHHLNFLLIGGVTLVSQLANGPRIWLDFRHGVFRICVSDGQEVVIVQNLSSLLHNSEGALCT